MAAAPAGSMAGLGWLMAAGALTDAYNIRQQGKIQKTRIERENLYRRFNQWAADRQAGLIVAASQRVAAEELRQADLVSSRALAVAAASGAGAVDPTVVALLARNRGEGHYRASVALYEGEERARATRIQGAGAGELDTEGVMAGANAAAFGRIAREGLSLYARYGLGGPDADTGGSASKLDWRSTGDFGGPAADDSSIA